jgi:hypothetical protein
MQNDAAFEHQQHHQQQQQQQRRVPPPNYHNPPSQGQAIVKLTSTEAASEAKKLKDSENFNLAIKVDKWSAVMFPAVFALFNICYWFVSLLSHTHTICRAYFLGTTGKDEWPDAWTGDEGAAVTKPVNSPDAI